MPASSPISATSARQAEPVAHEALDALARFIEQPGEIGVYVSPASPDPPMSFFLSGSADPRALKQRLGITIAAK